MKRIFDLAITALLVLLVALTFLGLAWGLWAGAKHDLRLLITYLIMGVCVILAIPGGPRKLRQVLSRF